MSITPLPLPPSRQDPANFALRADEFLGALPAFATEADILGITVNAQTALVASLYDSFDDRYLGAKSTAPALDNDGNALLIGALYWNTGFNDMRVWTGSAWVPVQTNSAATQAADILTQVQTVAAAAETSASLAATTYDSFDDRYLGAKSSAPSTDNDGNALLVGALYWSTATNELFIWTGSTWNVLGSGVTAFNGRNGSVVLNQTDVESALASATDFTLPNLTVTGDFLRPATVESIYEPAYSPGDRDDIVFHTGGTGFIGGEVKDVVVQSDGKLICVGSFTSYNGQTRNRIVRIGPTGEQDTQYSSFIDTEFNIGTGFNGTVETVALQSDGKIICGGSFTEYNGTAINRIVRLNIDGTLDNTFINGTGFNNTVQAVVVDANGKILVGGNFTQYAGTSSINRIVRLNANGGRDTTFTVGTGCDQTVRKIVIDSANKVILGGDFDFFNDSLQQGIVRLNATGTRDTSFNPTAVTGGQNPGTNGEVYALALQSDGRILVGGAFSTYNGVAVSSGIIRINANGSRDTAFSAGETGVDTGVVRAITIQPDGKILLGGSFGFYDTYSSVGNFVRVNSNGTLDTTFVTDGGFNGTVNALKLTTRTRAVAVGNFNYYGPQVTQIYDITLVYYGSFEGLNIEPPTTGEAGYLRYNKNSNSYQAYNGTEWAHLHKVTPAPRRIESGSSIEVSFTGPDFVVFDSSSAGGAVVSGINYRAGTSVFVQVKNPYGSARPLTFPSNWIFVTTKPTELAIGKTGLLTLRSFGTTEADCIATWQTN